MESYEFKYNMVIKPTYPEITAEFIQSLSHGGTLAGIASTNTGYVQFGKLAEAINTEIKRQYDLNAKPFRRLDCIDGLGV